MIFGVQPGGIGAVCRKSSLRPASSTATVQRDGYGNGQQYNTVNAVAGMLLTCQKIRHVVCHVGTLGDTFLHHVADMSNDMSPTCRRQTLHVCLLGGLADMPTSDICQLSKKLHPRTPMPSLVKTTKQWGKLDKAALHQLIVDGDVDIEDLSFKNIDAVQARYFPHRQQRNFRRNFKDFASAFDLKLALAGARRQAVEEIKV